MSTRSILTIMLVLAFGSLLAIFHAPGSIFAESSAPTAAASRAGSSTQTETITGRISSINTKAGTFDVRSLNGAIVHLKGSKDANPNRLRKGERVIVTYASGVALTIQATRNEKSL